MSAHASLQTPRLGSPQCLAQPAVVDHLVQAGCRCHQGSPPAVRDPLAASALRSRVPARLLGPLVRHVQARTSRDAAVSAAEKLDGDGRVSLLVADRWLHGASHQLGDPVLGLNALSELKRGGEDLVLLAAECAPTFHDALLTLIRHLPLVCEAADLHLHVEAGLAVVSLRYAVELSPVTRDFLLGALVRVLQGWIRGAPRFELWLSDVRPTRSALYTAVFAPLRVEFGSSCDAIVFPDALLAAPSAKANLPVHAALLRTAEQLLREVGRPASFTDQVRRQVCASLAAADNCAHLVASALGVSGRTLARRLNEEGTTFTSLLEEVRIECARYYLERSELESRDISRLLGYSCTATFCRAFQRWHGTTPRSYRRTQRALFGHFEG